MVGERLGSGPLGQLRNPQGGGHSGPDQLGIGDLGQRHEPGAVREGLQQGGGDLHGQAGLARPGRPGHTDQAAGVQQPLELGELAAAADEAGALGREVVLWPWWRCWVGHLQDWVLEQDLLLAPAQPAARLDAQLLVQDLAGAVEGLEGIGLAARAVQRQHQLAPQPLPVGVVGQQRLQLGDQPAVPTEGQVGLDAVLQRGQAQRLQAGPFRLQGGHLVQVGQQRSPPQAQPRSKLVGGRLRVVADQGAAARCGQVLEPLGVQLTGRHLELVARRAGGQPPRVRAERAAEPVDIALQGVAGGGRRVAVPQVLDQPVVGDDLASVDQQQPEQGALARGPKVQRLASGHHLKRSQDPELHRPSRRWLDLTW